MAVNELIYGGRTIFNITDSTAAAENTLEGVVGYGADGERFVGTMNVSSFYATGRRLQVTLPVSGWAVSGTGYAQTVAANVNGEKAIVQILLSDDGNNRLAELEADDALQSVTLQNGRILVKIAALPTVPLILDIAIINGLSANSKAALMSLDSKSLSFTLRADLWAQTGDSHIQSVTVEGLTDGTIFGDVLLDDEDSAATDEMYNARCVGKFEHTGNVITAICYGYPPEIDLHYFIKLFNKE